MAFSRSNAAFGWLFIALGVALVAVALGVIPVDPASVHAPGWVLALCGALFGLGGLAVVARRWPAVQSAAVGLIWLAASVVGGWIALFGEAEHFSGGLPVLPPGVNVGLARALFGTGAVLSLAVFVWGTVQLVRRGPAAGGRPPA